MKLTQAWERFWFKPQATSPLALVRITAGIVSFGWGLALLPDLFTFYSNDGIVPVQPEEQGEGVWGLLGIFPSDAALVAVYVALLVGSVALALGCFSRVAALVVLVGLLSFARRDVYVLNSGDGLLRNLVLFLVLAPGGESLSLDRWRRCRRTGESFWDFPERAPWALRLLQIQLSVLYVSTVWTKVRGINWNDGTAVSYANRLDDLARFPLPSFMTDSVMVSNVLTFGTLAVELSLGILIWNRVLRPYVIALGVGLHAGIDYSIRVGFFSYAIFACYVAFIPPETASRAILATRDRLRSGGLARRRAKRRTAAEKPAIAHSQSARLGADSGGRAGPG